MIIHFNDFMYNILFTGSSIKQAKYYINLKSVRFSISLKYQVIYIHLIMKRLDMKRHHYTLEGVE